ncbi:hypothetical protein K3F48_10855 [Methylosinus sp. Sm6]|nr:hypothetical protein [Methylosinus sp. Sm6]
MLIERLLALATGAIVAICLGVGLVMMAFGPGRKDSADPPHARFLEASPTIDRAAARSQIEKVIAGAPEYRPFFDRLRSAFPGDYDSTLDAFATGGAGADSVDFYLAEAVRRLRQARGILAARAEPAALARVFDLNLAVLRALAGEDKRLCAAFLYGGVDHDFHNFAARRRALVGEMATVGLEAIASGRTRNEERAAPSDEDFHALETALIARGLGKAEIGSLLDGKTPDPPFDDEKTCAMGQTYLEALRGLEEPVRLRIWGLAVELMARS